MDVEMDVEEEEAAVLLFHQLMKEKCSFTTSSLIYISGHGVYLETHLMYI